MTTVNIARYDSLSEIANKGRAGKGSSKKAEAAGGWSWYGTTSYDAAVSLAASGWRQGGEQIAAAISLIRPKVSESIKVMTRMTYLHTVNQPGTLDMGRYAVGHPQCIISPVLSGSTPIVKIAVPALWSGATSTERIMECGAVVSAVAEVLTAAGYGVEIVALAGWGRADGSTQVVEVVLKQSTEKTDIEDLAFGIAHPSMSRRFIFAAGELFPFAQEIGCWQGGGYGGHAHRWSGSVPGLIAGLADIDLTGMADNHNARQDAVAMAIEAINKWQNK